MSSKTEQTEPPAVTDDESHTGLLARAAILVVMVYRQAISPLLPASCRYRPTCSQYTLTALRRYGFFRGSWMGIRRILRCHPFHSGGHDPVP